MVPCVLLIIVGVPYKFHVVTMGILPAVVAVVVVVVVIVVVVVVVVVVVLVIV